MGSILVSAFCFAITTMLVKAAGPGVPVAWVAFMRCAPAFLFLYWLLRRRDLALASPRWQSLALRGGLGVAAMCCQFWALPRMPLANTILLSQSTPIFASLWAVLFLEETLDRSSVACIGLAFLGVYVILRPALDYAAAPAAAALASALFASLAFATLKSLTRDEPAPRIVAYFMLVGSLAFLPGVLASGYLPTGKEFLLMGGVCLSATIGQMYLTEGIHLAPVTRASTASFVILLLNILGGWAFWGEVPDAWTWTGALLVGAGIYGLMRK